MAKRTRFQIGYTLLTNIHLKGYLTGKIYQGKLKNVCVPGLNCYSCPGAVFACPIGSLQTSFSQKGAFAYVAGFMLLFGAIFARLICGFLCPFGLVQDLLHKIPLGKKIKKLKYESALLKLKYIVLGVFVLALPLLFFQKDGILTPYFCKYICPSGTGGAGIPLLILNPSMRVGAGLIFLWKLAILLFITISSIYLYRPFCKYLCPLGAFYGLFNRMSLFRLEFLKENCTDCNQCISACKMNLNPKKQLNHRECILCMDCKNVCKYGAIKNANTLNPLIDKEVTKGEKI